ncbi:hypothetical protein Tco_1450986, partial [Tanacetum coccineum]
MSETSKEPVCDSVTPSSLPQDDSSTPCKDSVSESITPRCMPDCILTPPTDESVITYTQLSGVQGVDTQSHEGFADVAGSGVDSLGLSYDESFGDDDLDLNLNKPEPILVEVSTQEPIVAKVIIEVPIVEEFFYDDEGINTTYETEYDIQPSEDAEPDVDVYMFGISMDLPFENIGITNLVSGDVLEGEDVDVINADGFDSDPINDEEKNYRKRRLAKLRIEMEGVINASGQWKYSFNTDQKFTTPKEVKDRVYLHSIESKRNLKLYKNDGVRIRARCDGKVPVFTMSQ